MSPLLIFPSINYYSNNTIFNIYSSKDFILLTTNSWVHLLYNKSSQSVILHIVLFSSFFKSSANFNISVLTFLFKSSYYFCNFLLNSSISFNIFFLFFFTFSFISVTVHFFVNSNSNYFNFASQSYFPYFFILFLYLV